MPGGLPSGDVLLHAGDFTKDGTEEEIKDFNTWLGEIKSQFKEIIVIGGNHDLSLDKNYPGTKIDEESKGKGKGFLSNATHVLETETVEVFGVKIFGSPHTPHIPKIAKMAFGKERGEESKKVWDKIEEGTDIVMAHGPPHGMLDQTFFGMSVGCEELRKAVDRVKPKFCVFGHIHEDYGVEVCSETNDTTTFINAASVSLTYKCSHQPIVFDIIPRK
ncbi:hypothetical protein TL16_g08198 [Triparma laevis f. inornata]|uniref:Calcineurin-like phosphoesterase domain-containing protein n=1 Tax=Triparma laevis f. inornata TaxID=1714386 RepID=A0A9W7EIY2_9STRA|nr:hypothetical protein TL16_g08198 [Triparma laevis f. inornata]